jgi:Protein of unknown function (DUF3551)
MRKLMLALLAVTAAGVGSIAGSAPAAAYDYPWCVYGGELGYSGDCSYQTHEQCLASASGRWNLYCDVNRRLLFQQQHQSQFDPQPQPQRRGRHHRRHHDE